MALLGDTFSEFQGAAASGPHEAAGEALLSAFFVAHRVRAGVPSVACMGYGQTATATIWFVTLRYLAFH